MAEDFLSQDEIDALLGEDKSTETKTQEEKIRPFDFSELEHIKKGDIPGLEIIFERWIKVFSERIRGLVPRISMVNKDSIYITKFENFMSKIPLPSSYSIVSMKPLKENFLFVLDSRLVFVIISVMFGGPAKPFKVEGRDFTRLETRIISDFVEIALSSFEDIWKGFYPVEVKLKSIELNPTLARIVSPNDKVIVVQCNMDIEGYEAPFFFCFPQDLFLPIKEMIFSETGFTKKDPIWDKELIKKIEHLNLSIHLELERKRIKVKDLINWKVGDEIQLSTRKDDLLLVYVEDKPKFKAKMGKMRDKYAALIKEIAFERDDNGRERSKPTESGKSRDKQQ
ncbi:flagellar motor switch protein FliM [Desulfurobacterium atlanticum]|uniref:Flagellar motor switch protein FliM n=1 Tax=Desulfurobacterium atlanticum TaxID=240169 RepID=A0A238YJQ9_9BACT|nr:flagellar motor switch protein FliM [Desulfurobacterium atlanticum]SNR71048.1 flagellar motor switch protein FliM [Desulfurobacterium atlanticum]